MTMPSRPAEDPGRNLGIIGLVLALFTAIPGLVVSIIALRSSRRAGFSNTPALAGIIVGAITTLLGLILAAVFIVGAVTLFRACQDLGPGTHQVRGQTLTCG